MPAIQASRRLVKSPPELWAEVSDAASLARHLGEVGEITITRLEPETTVAWEGEHASGTVELAPAGWGTAVTLTAEPVEAAVAQEPPAPEAAPEPGAPDPTPAAVVIEPEPERVEAEPEPTPEPEATSIEARPDPAPEPTRRGWLARLFRRTPAPAATPEPEPSTTDADRTGGAGETTSAAPPTEASPPATGPARSSAEPEPEQRSAQHPLESALMQALDSLGQAHHRPFSRG